jgi:hypothetical protein
MSKLEEKKPTPSKTVQICTMIFLALGIGVFQVVAPRLFPTPPGGIFNWERILWAGLVGGVCAGIGAGIGKLIDYLKK